jgi:hypothetical protein
LLRFHCVQAQFIQESLDGAFTAFKRSLSKNLWMALSLRSSAAYPRIFGWRFHFVQAQFIQESLDGAFTLFKRSLSYWAYPKPFKNISFADVFAFAFSSPH